MKKDPERIRRKWMAACLACMAAELAGAVMIFCGIRGVGLAVACTALIFWGVCSRTGVYRYQQACTEEKVRRGLKLAHPEFPSRREADSAGFLTDGLLPPGYAGDRPLYLHTVRGDHEGRPVALTELTLGYRREGANERRYLSGSLLMTDEPGCPEGLRLTGGEIWGRTAYVADERVTLLERHGWRLLSPREISLPHGTAETLDRLVKKTENVILFTGKDRAFLFLPGRFYSGKYSLYAACPAETLSVFPLPGIPEALAAADALKGSLV